jgi:hypothetical protein
MSEKLTINAQAVLAAKTVNELFVNSLPPIPEGATVESLWIELCRQKGKIKNPKKAEAVQVVLEHPALTGLTIPLIADIIQKVFKMHNVPCDTSDNSIRWYISQRTLDWDIKPRDKSIINTSLFDTL